MRTEARTDHASASAARGRNDPAPSGILLVDKPVGLTSHGVVDRLRRWLKLDKAGHCGTLDPFATGVLVICVNQATRIAEHLLTQDKHYRFTVRFGVRTDTQDCTGDAVAAYDGPPFPEAELLRLLPEFSGTFEQQVPKFAAVKVNGKPLYAYARQGRSVDLPTREVTVHELKLLDYRWPDAALEVISSKGTYIRQLADDLGQALGCGAHVSALTRLASGPYTLDQATALEEFKLMRKDSSWQERLIPLRSALTHLPQAVIEEQTVMRCLRNGQLPIDWELRQRKLHPHTPGPVRLVAGDGQLLGLWWPNPDKGQRRLRIFKPLP
jgi:tRNA pseudouridine55 synthase